MNKRNICFITGSRAEYGHLYWLLRESAEDPALKIQVIATGAHLSKEFGDTYRMIEDDGFRIDEKLKVLDKSDSEKGMSRSIARALEKFTCAYQRLSPDLVVVLGDRYEIYAAALAAYISRLPVAHIHGGEVTKGAVDEAFRHSITKMASFHFTATETYKKRVIRMGESPDRVFNVGAPGLDNIYRLKLMSRGELEEDLGFSLKPPVSVVTYHPVTLGNADTVRPVRGLLSAVRKTGIKCIFTMPGADTGYREIKDVIADHVKNNPDKACFHTSLGQRRYLSTLKYATLMIGNSSSGIVEAPSFSLPVVNIGDRQGGRIKARNIIDCGHTAVDIEKAIRRGLDPGFKDSLKSMRNPYGAGRSSYRIKEELKKVPLDKDILKKGFYDG